MKKIILSLVLTLSLCVSFVLAGCTQNTEYDDKKIVKIETGYYGGYVEIDSHPTRTFDFESGTVTDEMILDEIRIQFLLEEYVRVPERFSEYGNYEAYEEYLKSKYNSPKQISTFSKEDAENLLTKVKSQGILTWKDRYENHNIDDLRWKYVEISFSDGTVKRTEFYNATPNKYKRIQKSFEKYLGVSMMWNGYYTEV